MCMYVLVLKLLKHVEQSNRPYNQDALNCVFQLVAHGYDDAAVQVYWSVRGAPREDRSNGSVLLRNMVIRGRVSRCFLYLLWSAARYM